jgi:hypothetical protein
VCVRFAAAQQQRCSPRAPRMQHAPASEAPQACGGEAAPARRSRSSGGAAVDGGRCAMDALAFPPPPARAREAAAAAASDDAEADDGAWQLRDATWARSMVRRGLLRGAGRRPVC